MRVLGIDPGLGAVGFGIIDSSPSGEYSASRWGVISTSKDKPDPARLQEIFEDVSELIRQTKPDVVSIERIFFFKNAKTLVPVSQARGVILLALQIFGLTAFEYTPMQVKQTMTGHGRADKKEVQQSLVQLLDLPKMPKPDDAADALALAICHLQHSR